MSFEVHPGEKAMLAPHGFISIGEFMQSAGLIEKVPGSWKDLVYANLKTADGS
ncbi:MAG TPA: hypothetical protein VKA73_14545 [Rubrobacter sp.]|nr:hypothetical protein [Rubrobacter sp.]